MILYIVRHAWAGEHGDPSYPDDRLRPLTSEGKKRFRRVARVLADRGVLPKVIGTSPLVRCKQTAQVLAENLKGHPKVVELDALAPGSNLGALAVWTNEQQVESVAWVGHAPDVGKLTAGLIGEKPSAIHFTKGACAAIEFRDDVAPGRGTLLWLVTAKLLGC
jgi:phosphohistidine phosphatase